MSSEVIKQLGKELDKLRQPDLKLLADGSIRIEGLYDVFDNLRVSQGQFRIKIVIPKTYPLGFPDLYELSNKIPRHIDRHISKNGWACVEILQKRILIGKRGITLSEFMHNYVHKFFCWQLLYESDASILKEWAHFGLGTLQFYQEAFSTDDVKQIVVLLVYLALAINPKHQHCPCGSTSAFEKCHMDVFDSLRPIGTDQFVNDVKELLAINPVALNNIQLRDPIARHGTRRNDPFLYPGGTQHDNK